MSLPEVQRTLKKRGIRLQDIDSFKQSNPNINLGDFSYISDLDLEATIERGKTESWYMPPLEMFESTVTAKFSFKDGKLFSTTLIVRPFLDLLSNTSTPVQVKHIAAEIISSLLKAKYKIVKDPNEEISALYEHHLFEGKSSSLIFMQDSSKQIYPTITLFITYRPPIDKRKAEIQKREASAF
jgi:hypothetical protein